MDIEWEDPPETALGSGRRSGKYLEFAIALRDHPGKWAVLPSADERRSEKGAQATSQNIRRGKVRGFPKGQYESVVDGTRIYVRYQPTDDSGSEDEATDSEHDDAPPNTLAPAVRAWAAEQGIEVPDRGRLPRKVIDQYMAAADRGEVKPLRAVPQG